MNKNNLLLSTALLLLGVICHGQGQRLGGPSAEAKTAGSPSASQGMENLYSPNLYDGSANISIPIYQYSVENNYFGISFGYNTKGIKVDLIASDIGLGWTLNAGASISRVQKDLPDEISLIDGDTLIYLPSNAYPPSVPYPGYNPPLDDTVSVNEFWAFKGKYATYFESPASASDALVYRDSEADDFVVTLGSGTFTFNLGKNGTIFTHPHRNVSVEVLWGDQPLGSIGDQQVIGSGTSNLLNFRIRDEQGNTYTFTRSDYKITTIYDPHGKSFPLTSYYSSSSWVVSKVKLASGAEITYHYFPLQYVLPSLPPGKTYSRSEGAYMNDCVDTGTYNDVAYTSKLSYVQYPNGIIAYFNYDSRIRADYPYGALREIRVAGGTQCLSYILQQAFFNSDPAMPEKGYAGGLLSGNWGVGGDRKLRLKLKGILLNSCDSSVQEPYYSFTYDETTLPERLSYQQDYFGYYKSGTGTPLVTSSPCNFQTAIPFHRMWIPQSPNYVWEYGFDRTPHFPSMKAAILKAVQNAYGGRAEFHYGPHAGISNVLSQVPAWDSLYFGENDDDGLRLDSIIELERFNMVNKKVTMFEYSGGQRFLQGGYFHYTDKLYGTDSTAHEKARHVMTSNFLTPHQWVNGSNHGYSQVNVVIRTNTGALLSRKEIKFSNFQDNGGTAKYIKTGSHLDFFTYPFTDKQYLMDWAMGLPLEVTEYDQNNRIVQKTINKYTFTLDTTSAIGKVDNQKIALIPVMNWRRPGVSRTQMNKSIRDFYHPFTGFARLDTTIVRKYLTDNAFLADTVRYHYDGRNNLSSIYSRNSKGLLTLTTQAYNYTLNSPLGSPLQNMTQAGLEKLVGTERWILGSAITENKLVDAYFNTFEYQNGRLRPKYLYNFQHGSPLTYSQYTGYTGGTNIPEPFANVSSAFAGVSIPYFVKTSEVILADLRGNPQETRMMGQNLYKSMIWDTLNSRKIAEANARYQDIAYTGFEATVKGNWTYNAAGVSTLTDAVAGGKGFLAQYGPVSRSGLTAGKEYIVAFWCTNYGTMPSCTIGGSTVPLTIGPSQGNWTYYEGRFTAPSSSSVVSISNIYSGSYLDELRLFPADAGMQCWSYKGMFGLSSETAVNGRITYYEYDKMGRQAIVRDQDRNILTKTEYHVEQ